MSQRKRVKSLRNRTRQVLDKLKGWLLLKLRYSPSKVIIMVDGGFCSVITKYTLGQCVLKKTGLPVEYDLTWFENNGMDCDGRHGRKLQFTEVFPHLKLTAASNRDIKFYKRYFYKQNKQPYKFNESLIGTKQPMYLDGYFEYWRYFDIVRQQITQELSFDHIALSPTNMQTLDKIRSEQCSVAVHVRRGDFLNLGLCFLTAGYYISAIRHIIRSNAEIKPHFFFFSNDMKWVRSKLVHQLPENTDYTLVNNNDNDTGYIDLQLIIACSHQISSNSSFGYWGGLLNTAHNKIVIIPDQWVPPENNNKNELADSELAHRAPNWLPFPHNEALT